MKMIYLAFHGKNEILKSQEKQFQVIRLCIAVDFEIKIG